ncbi:MAG TPA: choice-of-anchor tandem repeat GloVer-containing protein [Methylocystis sp.]|nr:choice-of-anchor tandem repeat GloVer-containing protein [Methylocystis sp.]
MVSLAAAIALAAATADGASAAPKETILHFFQLGTSDGQTPDAGLAMDSKGNLYGTTEFGGALNQGVAFKISPDGKETVLHSFVGGDNDGAGPLGSLLPDKDGNLYGTTAGGGKSGKGVVFKLAPPSGGSATDWTETLLHTFTGGGDGNQPAGALLLDKDGNLYGAAPLGGDDKTCDLNGFGPNSGCGTVFKITPDGAFSVLYAFEHVSDGDSPNGFLIADTQGDLYGLANGGGDDTPCPADAFEKGCGTVFKLTPPSGSATSWTKTTLYTFTGGSDGGLPYTGVIADSKGNLYGTTFEGGKPGCDAGEYGKGCGAVFKLAPGGTLTTLHAFTGGSDGGGPTSTLIADCKGNLYGTATLGGDLKACSGGCGTVFKITPDGAFSVLYAFKGAPNDGTVPELAGVIADSEGNLYGTTQGGGVTGGQNGLFGNGTVYKLTDTGFVTGKACSS